MATKVRREQELTRPDGTSVRQVWELVEERVETTKTAARAAILRSVAAYYDGLSAKSFGADRGGVTIINDPASELADAILRDLAPYLKEEP